MSNTLVLRAEHERGKTLECVEFFIDKKLHEVVKEFVYTNEVFMDMCDEMTIDVIGCAMAKCGVIYESHDHMEDDEINNLGDFWRNPRSIGRRAFDEISLRRKRLVSILINEGVFKTMADSVAEWEMLNTS